MTLVVLTGLAACGRSRQFNVQGSNQAPGADATVRVERQDGGNYLVSVHATNLLPPARVNEALTTYVVWFQPQDQAPQRVGTLAYNDGDRAGEMTATTPNTNFQVVISGEASPDVAAPSDHVVFRVAVDAPQ